MLYIYIYIYIYMSVILDVEIGGMICRTDSNSPQTRKKVKTSVIV